MSTTLDTVGRRIYFRGAPYGAREALKSAGASWDADQRAWYVGTQRRAEAEALLARLATPREETLAEDDRRIVGRATYRGVSYVVLWEGVRQGVLTARLASRDGQRIFWARGDDLQIAARYKSPRSLADLREYAERRAREARTGLCECRCHRRDDCHCPGWCPLHHDGCDACGCES